MTAKQIHALQPGDRVLTRVRFQGRRNEISPGCPGIVQVVVVELHLGDVQRVEAADIKWRGGRIENLQADELTRWVMLRKKAPCPRR